MLIIIKQYVEKDITINVKYYIIKWFLNDCIRKWLY